jgi:hypothetical protein
MSPVNMYFSTGRRVAETAANQIPSGQEAMVTTLNKTLVRRLYDVLVDPQKAGVTGMSTMASRHEYVTSRCSQDFYLFDAAGISEVDHAPKV